MSTKAKRHIHKYHRIKLNSSDIWACALGDCNHYMPRHLSQMVPGKTSLCWSCGNEITLDPENMKDDRPVCRACKSGVNFEDDAIPPDVIAQLLSGGNK